MNLLPRIRNLSPAKRRLLRQRLAEGTGALPTSVLRSEQLVAYVVPRAGTELTASGLRNLLLNSLPSYMIPAAFIFLEALPRLPNGKVDRKALPEPQEVALPLANSALITSLEEVLLGFWGDVLGHRRAGLHDNFFEVGGHSLLAVQLLSRLREAFQIDLPLRQLFETPTVSGLAALLGREPGERRRIDRIAELLLQLAETPDDELDQMHARIGSSTA